jgi:parallel beta-helix repeat protein
MRKKIQLAVCCLGILFISFSAYGKNYYFSSSTGNDSYTNSISTPWKSITKLNAVFSTLLPGDSILFKRGDTFYGSVVVAASGSASSPIVLGAYGSGIKPVITGFIPLTSWTSIGNGIYESHSTSFAEVVNSLVFNGSAREMGRWPKRNAPNSGYRTISSAVSNTSITDNSLSGTPSWTGGEVVIRKNRWTLDRNKITSHSGSTINYTTGNGASANAGYGYFIQNHIKTLTELGDWYYNPATKKMNVFFGTNTPTAHTVKASTIKYVISITNRSYITLTDLTIEGANNDNIRIKDGGTGVVVKKCDVKFAGEIGIEVDDHSNLIIENCIVSNSNDSGINISSDSQSATVRNNTVENSGALPGMGTVLGSGYVGIQNYSNYGVTEYNRVIKSGYNGIMHKFVGNKIRYNYVDTFCFVKDDGGGIYGHNNANINHTGTQIIGNIVLNGIGAREGTTSPNPDGIGIYLDDNATGVEVSGNTVAHCFRGIYIHNARNSVITKNTIYNNDLAQVHGRNDGIGDDIVNITLTDNILFAKKSSQLAAWYYSSSNQIKDWGKMDNNYYCRPVKDDITIKNQHKYGANETITLSTWKTRFPPMDSYSKDSPLEITDADKEIRFEYNATNNPKTIALDAVYTDVKGVQYTKVTLAAFSSVILIKSGTITTTTPDAPTVTVVNNCNGTSTLTAKNYTGSLLWSTGETASVITVQEAGTYTVTQTVNGSKSAPAEGTANPKASPIAPAAKSVTYCTGDIITSLTASGATGASFKWYKNSDLSASSLVYTGTSFATGISNSNASVSNYWVTQSVSGCESPATAITVTVKECTTSTPTPPDASVNGLNYKYYTTNSSNRWKVLPDFSSLTPDKTGIVNNFNISSRTQSDFFGFTFEGLVEVDVAGTYTFYTYSDDGSQLFIGNKLLVNNDGVHGAKELSGTVYLTAGKHAIKATYFDYTRGEILSVKYAGPGFSKRLIPDNKLFLGSSESSSDSPISKEPDSGNSTDSTAPSNLTATANAYYSIAGLGWKDNSSNEKGFEVHMSVGNNTSYKQVGSTGAGKIRYSVAISKGQVYYFKIRAKIGTGHSDFSNEVMLDTNVASNTRISSADSLDNASINKAIDIQTAVYPNPASEYVNIAFGSEFSGPVMIQLTDLSGQQLHTQAAQAEAGSSCRLNLERHQLLPGLYIVNISNGVQSKSLKLYIE